MNQESSTTWLALLRRAGWAPLAVLLLHGSLALLGVRDEADALVHFCGGAAIAWFAWHAGQVVAWFGVLRRGALLVLAFAATCTAALLVELLELGVDQLFGTHMQQSLRETMLDLVTGVAGGIVALAVIWLTTTRRRGS